MFKLTNYINGFILLILIILVSYFNSLNAISTQFQSILPNNEQKELLQKFNEFQTTKKVLLYVHGLEKESLTKIKNIENELLKINGLTQEKNQINKNLQQYKEDYKFYIRNFNTQNLKNLTIDSTLEQLKSKLINADFTYFFDKNDPLELLEKNETPKNFSLKEGHLIIKELGYLSVFTIDSSINSLSHYETLYDAIHTTIHTDEDVKLFSPIFYFVENSRMMQDDINTIILSSTGILFLLYILILKNIKLLMNSFITICSSILFALLLCSFIFNELSIFVIVFGISISTVAIDYMFHHYVHKHYEKKKNFNKDVFFGMFTTVGVFFILSFISFDLIKEICYFSIFSLLFSYVQFSFLYPKIGFIYQENKKLDFKLFPTINPRFILLLSILIIFISMNNLTFDSNLRNLDVENKRLAMLENFFNEKLTNQNNIPILIKGNSIDSLIENSKRLQNESSHSYIPLSILISENEFLKKKIYLENINIRGIKSSLEQKALELGFKEDFFKKAYVYDIEKPQYTQENISNLGLDILAYKDYFISYANVPKHKAEEFYQYPFVENLSIKTLFEENLILIKQELLWCGFLTVLFIVAMVFISNKKNYLTTLAYIIFPFSMILLLCYFFSFNILHLFMLFIVLSISIDYGIYMSSSNNNHNTHEAILYSLLSTFAGFGVLIFSNINALFSMGITATTGILAIAVLLIILKRSSNAPQSI